MKPTGDYRIDLDMKADKTALGFLGCEFRFVKVWRANLSGAHFFKIKVGMK